MRSSLILLPWPCLPIARKQPGVVVVYTHPITKASDDTLATPDPKNKRPNHSLVSKFDPTTHNIRVALNMYLSIKTSSCIELHIDCII